MKVQAIGLACLIAGAFAAPVQEQAQNTQVQPHAPNAAPVANPMAVADPLADEPDLGDPEGTEEGAEEGTEEGTEGAEPDMINQAANIGFESLKALHEMVNQVHKGVQAAQQAMKRNNGNTETLTQALADPLSRIEQAVTAGVSRRTLPGIGGIPGIGDILGGNKGGDNKGSGDNFQNFGSCNNNQKQVCCNGVLGCTVVNVINIVPITQVGCDGGVYCCDNSQSGQATGIDVDVLNCVQILS